MLPHDPNMLLSVVNTKLRDEFSDLDELCDALDVSRTDLTEQLRAIGRVYHAETNQFN